MICKHCGAEIPSSANKCKRCGTRIPAKSSCGGFYDLASAGEKLWKDAQPKEPAPVYGAAPAVQYVQDTRGLMILRIIAAVLAVALLVTLITQCSIAKSKDAQIEALEAQLQVPTTNKTPDPAEPPALADCNTAIEMNLNSDGTFHVTTTVETSAQDNTGSWTGLTQKDPIAVTWNWTAPEITEPEASQPSEDQAPSDSRTVDAEQLEDEKDTESGETAEPEDAPPAPAPEEEPVNKNYILTVTVTPNPECFGEAAEDPVYTWYLRKVDPKSQKATDWEEINPEMHTGFSTENGVLTCDFEVLDRDLFDLEFRLVYTRTNAASENEQTAEEAPETTAGTLTVTMEGFTCPRPEKDGAQKEEGGQKLDGTNNA